MAATLNLTLASQATTLAQATNLNWTAGTNKMTLSNNSETPNFHSALGTTGANGNVYASANEVSGTGWAAGGVACSALASGGTIFPSGVANMTVTGGTPSAANWTASNVSVATTTLSGAYACYIYAVGAFTANVIIAGIWFGGSSYSTTAGTFAITWSGGIIATISCAAV